MDRNVNGEDVSINVDKYIENWELEDKERYHVPITPDDIKNVPEILANPDWISLGSLSNDGHAVLSYHKKENDGTFTVVELIYGRDKTLRFKTMWKDSIVPTSRTYSTSDHTSKNENNTSPSTSDSSVSRETESVKYSVRPNHKTAIADVFTNTEESESTYQAIKKDG